MTNLIELSGSFFSSGVQVPFDAVIRMPEQDRDSEDYFCRVVSQQLFSRPMDAYGVSQNQAACQAIDVLKSALISRVMRAEDEWGPPYADR